MTINTLPDTRATVRVVLVAITKHGAQQVAQLARQLPQASVCVAEKFAPLMAGLANPVTRRSSSFRCCPAMSAAPTPWLSRWRRCWAPRPC